MTYFKALSRLLARTVEVNSSSIEAQEVPLGLKKAPKLNLRPYDHGIFEPLQAF